jgi:hypothetical protein
VDVLILQIFVSLGLVAGAIVLFAFSVKERSHEESHRLALFPLESDESAENLPAPADQRPARESNP